MMLEHTPFSAPSLESRLENWGSWSRRQMIIYEQCESFEGCYRSPQHWTELNKEQRIPPEQQDAMEINSAAGTLILKHQLTLKLGYVFRKQDHQVAEELRKALHQRIKTMQMAQIYADAKAGLATALVLGGAVRRARVLERVRLLLPKIVEDFRD